jgi:glycosyltransferase involved in cell wall biosynthesis
VWGPLGGGESAPRGFLSTVGLRGRLVETIRIMARWFGERDPLLRGAMARCTVALATTSETADRLRTLDAERVAVLGHVALNGAELSSLLQLPIPASNTARFISMGRLLYWKGFHLGIEAFARADIPNAEYWIVGDGPDRRRLKGLVAKRGLGERVKLLGAVPRKEALARLAECDVLLHPSLHDSGGWVCVEAMASGRPVVCLDLGGPATVVTAETGIRVKPHTPAQAVGDLANAMATLVRDGNERSRMSEACRTRVREFFTWEYKAEQINERYAAIVEAAFTSA